MMKLERTKKEVREALASTPGPVVLYFSAGSDSLLLLNILFDLKVEFSMVCFDHTFTKAQRRQVDEYIKQFDLRVFSYRPSNAYLIGDGKRLSLVEEYQLLSGKLMPFVRDVVHDESRCAVTDVTLGPWHEGPAPVGFALSLFGTRKTDRHYATGRAWRTEQPEGFIAPLWEWTRKDVREGLKHYGLTWPRLDTGSLPMCTNCLCGEGKVFCPKTGGMIDAIKWDPRAMTAEFRSKYAFV